MNFISDLQETLSQQIKTIIRGYEGDLSAANLSEMERATRALCQQVGNEILSQWITAQAPKYPEDTVCCPHCGEAAQYVRRRSGVSLTLLGRVSYTRPYYQCPHCHQGHHPLDADLTIQPGQMSGEVKQMAALMGIHASFATSRDLLWRTTQLELSANSIRKATLEMGARVMEQEAAWGQQSQDLETQGAHHRTSDPPQQVYGSLDGFSAHIDGDWHEVKAGTWWVAQPDRNGDLHAHAIRYYTDRKPAADFSALTWTTGFQRAVDQADEVIFVADGAEWIWRIVAQHFPHAVQILDWYHALHYVQDLAQAAFKDETERQVWLAQQTEALWQGRRSLVFRACRACAQRAPDGVNKTLTFLTHQRTRMRYDLFRAAGYQIGSGTMESGCKQLGQGRLKIAGAQWHDEGARRVAKARAAYLSEQWDELNAPSFPLPLVA